MLVLMNLKSLGKFETGAKTAMPIFKEFVKKAVKKKMLDHLKLQIILL